MTVSAAIAVALAYLLGSLDFAVIAARLRGVDIYSVGSGNPGTANVLRNLGWKVAAPVMLGDLAKGALAAWAGRRIGGDVAGYAAAFAAVAGHCFPIWHRFRGGKGVATALGAAAALHPIVGAAMGLIWAGLLAATKISSIGSLTAIIVMTPGVALAGAPLSGVMWILAAAVLVIARHRENIRRLLAGQERRARRESA